MIVVVVAAYLDTIRVELERQTRDVVVLKINRLFCLTALFASHIIFSVRRLVRFLECRTTERDAYRGDSEEEDV